MKVDVIVQLQVAIPKPNILIKIKYIKNYRHFLRVFFKQNQMFIMDLSADFVASTTHTQDTVHLLGSWTEWLGKCSDLWQLIIIISWHVIEILMDTQHLQA